jgi:L-threonylcarbamoyladenylate synthase
MVNIEKIKINTRAVIKKTGEVIRAGGMVVFPSDTVYILAVDPTNKKAVEKLLAFKNRWTGKAISIAVADKKMALDYVKLTKNEEKLYANLLPGPFTIVSKGKGKVAKGIEAENGTLGIRIPDNKYIKELVEELGGPVTATSANLAGRRSNYSIESFLRPLPRVKKEMIDLVVDGGKLPKNKPSTVIETAGGEIKVLRRGELMVGKEEILISNSEKETEKIGEFIVKKIINKNSDKPIVLGLSGDLGCGKTVFARGIGKYLGVKEKITSPTFFIWNEYEVTPKITHFDKLNPLPRYRGAFPFEERGIRQENKIDKFLHFDLYRIENEFELEEIKFLEQFKPGVIACVEWPELMGKNYFEKIKKMSNYLTVEFRYISETEREIKFSF